FGQAAHDDVGAIEFHEIPFITGSAPSIAGRLTGGGLNRTGGDRMLRRFAVHGTAPPEYPADPARVRRKRIARAGQTQRSGSKRKPRIQRLWRDRRQMPLGAKTLAHLPRIVAR